MILENGETSLASDSATSVTSLYWDQPGELLCIELIHGSKNSVIYWGSLQAAMHLELFERALDHITEEIKSLVQQKIQLGVLPPQAAQRLPERRFRTVQSILAIADPNDQSAFWERLQEVMTLFPAVMCSVVEIRSNDDLTETSRT